MSSIRKVTDLRTGLVHPERHQSGKYMSRRTAACEVEMYSRIMGRAERGEPGYRYPRHIRGFVNSPKGYITLAPRRFPTIDEFLAMYDRGFVNSQGVWVK